jgi:hypothetical protein
LGVTDGIFRPARKADSGGKIILKLPAMGGQIVHYAVAVAAAKRAMFLPISIQRVCIRKLQNNHCNGVEAEPLNQIKDSVQRAVRRKSCVTCCVWCAL